MLNKLILSFGLFTLFSNTVRAENTSCETFVRPPATVGLGVWVNAWSLGKIKNVYTNGKVKVEYTLSEELLDYDAVAFQIPCLKGLRIDNAVYTRNTDGTPEWRGTVDALYDTGFVDAGRPGKGRSHSILNIDDVIIPLEVDPTTGVKTGEKGLYKNKAATVLAVFVGNTSLIKTDCGWLKCSYLEIPTADLVRQK